MKENGGIIEQDEFVLRSDEDRTIGIEVDSFQNFRKVILEQRKGKQRVFLFLTAGFHNTGVAGSLGQTYLAQGFIRLVAGRFGLEWDFTDLGTAAFRSMFRTMTAVVHRKKKTCLRGVEAK